MTKYGHESGSIAISRLPAWIVDRVYISKKDIQFIYFPYLQNTFTLTIACKAKHSHL